MLLLCVLIHAWNCAYYQKPPFLCMLTTLSKHHHNQSRWWLHYCMRLTWIYNFNQHQVVRTISSCTWWWEESSSLSLQNKASWWRFDINNTQKSNSLQSCSKTKENMLTHCCVSEERLMLIHLSYPSLSFNFIQISSLISQLPWHLIPASLMGRQHALVRSIKTSNTKDINLFPFFLQHLTHRLLTCLVMCLPFSSVLAWPLLRASLSLTWLCAFHLLSHVYLLKNLTLVLYNTDK